MNNLGLLEYAKRMFNEPNYYVYGTFGQILTEKLLNSKINQYPSYYTNSRIQGCRNNYGKRAFDCVGLIKFFYWGENTANYNKPYGSDLSANGIYNKASVKGDISTIDRNCKGICVHMEGHVGIYAGDGTVYECTISQGSYKIIRTKLDGRGWKHWFRCPYIDFIEEPKQIQQPENKPIPKNLYLPATANKWAVYPLDKQPVVKNAVAYLNPKKYGGLTYEILGNPYPNVVTIQTQMFGKVNIYVAPSTGAVIK